MAPEAPEIPTTILLVIAAQERSGSCPRGRGPWGGRGPQVGGPGSPHPPAARSLRHGSPAAAGPRARGSRAPRSPVPPAALGRPAIRSAGSGRITFRRFFGGPMAHPHVATAIAKEGVDLPVVGQSLDDFADKEDVITGRVLLAYPAPHHCQAARHSRCCKAGLFGDRDLEGGELVGTLAGLAGGDRELLL